MSFGILLCSGIDAAFIGISRESREASADLGDCVEHESDLRAESGVTLVGIAEESKIRERARRARR